MQSRIDKFEALGRALDEACKLAQQLYLEHLPFLLEMAKLEFFSEVETDLTMNALPSAGEHHSVKS